MTLEFDEFCPQMRDANAAAGFNPRIDRGARSPCELGGLISADHVRGLDALSPVLGAPVKQRRGLRFAGVRASN